MIFTSLPATVTTVLGVVRTIAVVGLSPKTDRPSHQVARYLLETGYTVIPVNPGQDEILGQTCYPNLAAVPVAVDMVNIFRRSQDVMPVVEEAIRIRAKTVWMQVGIIDHSAARRAEQAGLTVIMDRCLRVDLMHFHTEETGGKRDSPLE